MQALMAWMPRVGGGIRPAMQQHVGRIQCRDNHPVAVDPPGLNDDRFAKTFDALGAHDRLAAHVSVTA